ncbi:uncharacterized protein LOC141533902 [Cotesia typhae]
MSGIRVCGCCGHDLRTATLVIGILFIVLNIGNLIRTPIEYTQACSSGMTLDDSVFCSWTKDSSNLGLAISSSVVEIILEVLMIYGSEKEKYMLMLPLLVIHAIGLGLTFGVFWFIITAVVDITMGARVMILLIGHLIFAVGTYLWMIVFNRCQEIKRQSSMDPEKHQLPPYEQFEKDYKVAI